MRSTLCLIGPCLWTQRTGLIDLSQIARAWRAAYAADPARAGIPQLSSLGAVVPSMLNP